MANNTRPRCPRLVHAKSLFIGLSGYAPTGVTIEADTDRKVK